jgi:aminoglycoside phosphotransferase family enzyme/predicted kinase
MMTDERLITQRDQTVELPRLIESLQKPDAYPHPVENIEVRQTHISVVFLAGAFVYKIKKPVHFDFVDFRDLTARRHFCDEEVRLNRRLAPDVYLETVPIVAKGAAFTFGGPGDAIEWAVKMTRLPEEATWESRVAQGDIGVNDIHVLAERLSDFHRSAERNDRISQFARFEAVATNLGQNLVGPPTDHPWIVHPRLLERLRQLTEDTLAKKHDLIDERAIANRPCDTHGDLHLDHIYAFRDRHRPADIVIVDCIEFNERFRYTDPVADMAFVVMDLMAHGRRDLARTFADAYFSASGDAGGAELLSLYVSYRAAVRGKVEGLKALEPEISDADKQEAQERSQARWLLALSVLESASRQPCLILIGGLPGTGKSTLAGILARRAGFVWIRSDVVRKSMVGIDLLRRGDAGLYTEQWSNATYDGCLAQAKLHLTQGDRVLVDAVFGRTQRRIPFVNAARKLGLPVLFLVCAAKENTIRTRLQERRGDPSDADWAVYQQAMTKWESPVAGTFIEIDMNGSPETGVHAALGALQAADLWS